jgi:hypothetical protein
MIQCSKRKVQRISYIENNKLERKGEGNVSTFSCPSPISSLLARFSRVSPHMISAAEYAGLLASTLGSSILSKKLSLLPSSSSSVPAGEAY